MQNYSSIGSFPAPVPNRNGKIVSFIKGLNNIFRFQIYKEYEIFAIGSQKLEEKIILNQHEGRYHAILMSNFGETVRNNKYEKARLKAYLPIAKIKTIFTIGVHNHQS